jgi:hypothetical protein
MKEYPKSVQDAVERLLSELSDTDKLAIQNSSKENLAMFHHGLGNYIRNEFGLWKDNEELLRDCLPGAKDPKPDDASSVIIKALWRSLQASS